MARVTDIDGTKDEGVKGEVNFEEEDNPFVFEQR